MHYGNGSCRNCGCAWNAYDCLRCGESGRFSPLAGYEKKIRSAEIAKTIDYAVLKPDATLHDVEVACTLAKQWNFASVCIRPDYISFAEDLLIDSSVALGTVIGFPLGYGPLSLKVDATDLAVCDGATEIDVVMNIGAFKDGKYDYVRAELQRVVHDAKLENAKILVKVILETCLLNDEEIWRACKLAEDARADYVKTSTGLAAGGATPHAVQIMLNTVGDNLGVKASGGIKTYDQAVGFLKQGCKRLGVSSIEGILI